MSLFGELLFPSFVFSLPLEYIPLSAVHTSLTPSPTIHFCPFRLFTPVCSVAHISSSFLFFSSPSITPHSIRIRILSISFYFISRRRPALYCILSSPFSIHLNELANFFSHHSNNYDGSECVSNNRNDRNWSTDPLCDTDESVDGQHPALDARSFDT